MLYNKQKENYLFSDRYKEFIIQFLLRNCMFLLSEIRLSDDTQLQDLLSKDRTLDDSISNWKLHNRNHPNTLSIDFQNAFKWFWSNKKVKNYWREHWINSSVPHSFGRMADGCIKSWNAEGFSNGWGSKGWVPSPEDILLLSIRTSGSQVYEMELNPTLSMEILDTGGQRNERRHWFTLFEDVSVIIFVVNISEYSENLFENMTVNRLQESLQVFREILSMDIFPEEIDFLIFFNKTDLFESKIIEYKIPIRNFGNFLDAPKLNSGSDELDIERSKEWILHKFKNIFHELKPHSKFTVATDSNDMFQVFDNLKEALLKGDFLLLGF
eukprot:maker-scaffold_3-snap-gene-18.48-mRNA-1 protein AED:0.82 eAED:0.82 QI:0/0/0/0.5/1/1/2/0/325